MARKTSSAGASAPLVLLVEDDEDTREMYAMCLAASGFRVVQALSGQDALAKAAKETPDVMVTDLSLPGMDGFDLARMLRARPGLDTVPIVAVTGHSVTEDASAKDAGITAVLLKPCLPDDLVRAIQTTLSRPQ